MARTRKETEGQLSFGDYELKQVNVRLKLSDGPSYYSKTPLSTPEDAVRVMKDILQQMDREECCICMLDNHLKPISYHVVSIGSYNASLVPIQNCMKAAILSNANNLMLFHNHPSGDVEPSEEDEDITKQLSNAAKLLGFNLVDHIIIGAGEDSKIFSMRDSEPWLFVDSEIDYDFIGRLIAENQGSIADKNIRYRDIAAEADDLAKNINDLAFELDPYVYLDTYDNRIKGYETMLEAVQSDELDKIEGKIREEMHGYPKNLQNDAENILKKIEKYRNRKSGIVSDQHTAYQTKVKNIFDPKQAAEEKKEELKEITKKLEKGVTDIFQSDKYKKFLDTMARFPRYSVNNNLLIMLQKPDASLCQSFTGWKQMGRSVKRGEHGIRILAPSPYKKRVEQSKLDANGKPILDQNGKEIKEETQVQMLSFKPVSTFDISQTEGDPIPTLGVNELEGTVEGYKDFFEALKRACPVPVEFEDIKSGAKGYFDPENNRIAIQSGMSEMQNVKTLIHEMTHQQLHSIDKKTGKGPEKSRSQKEVEAESTAYTVCQHYGIDTSDYSFGYVAGWSEGREMPELKASLETIRTAAYETITSVDEKLGEIKQETEGILYEYQDGFCDVKKSEDGEWTYQIIDQNNVITNTGVVKNEKTAGQAAVQALKTEKGYEGKIFVSCSEETSKIRQEVKENLESVRKICGMHM